MNNHAWDDSNAYYAGYMEDVEYYSSQAKLEDFDLKKNDKFLYIFDFGQEWRFGIKVLCIEDEITLKPQIIKSVGEPPEQYEYFDE